MKYFFVFFIFFIIIFKALITSKNEGLSQQVLPESL